MPIDATVPTPLPTASRLAWFPRALGAIALAATALLGPTDATAQTCPCSLWPANQTPGPVEADAGAVELGVKFQADVSGVITGLRFYKYAQNTGTHVGNLWSSTGTLLGTVTFNSETASGWQTATFVSPIAIAANTTYIASYHTNTGFYAVTSPGLTTAVNSGSLHALADAASGGNGVYRYGASSAFPNQTYNASNYWVDVSFSPAADVTPPTVTTMVPASGATGVTAGTTIAATFNEPLAPASVGATALTLTGPSGAVSGAVTYDSTTRTVQLTPGVALATATTYTARVKGGAGGVTDVAGNALAADVTWTFTTAAPVVCPCSLWSPATPPSVLGNDASAVELGLKFRSDSAGFITAIRFYKYSQNTGTHVGSLWSTSGQLLGRVTFANETSSGWQLGTLTTPVAIAANTTYVVSYHTNSGFYADTQNDLITGVDTGPLHAPSTASAGGNGVYRYNANAIFPDQTYLASNYWVDVVFTTTDTTPPSVVSMLPVSGATGVSTSTTVSATFSEALTPASVSASTFTLTGPGNTSVAAALGYTSGSTVATLTPTTPLVPGTTYTATVKGGSGGVADVAGNLLPANVAWTFTTLADTTPPTVSAVSPAPGAVNVPLSSVVTMIFSEAMNAASVLAGVRLTDNGVPLAAIVDYDSSTRIATITPNASLPRNRTLVVTVVGGAAGVKDLAGNPLTADASWSFGTALCPCSIWTDATVPPSSTTETAPVELGMKFRTDMAGAITAIRFYKSTQNTGPHPVSLWTTAGQLLATATSASESASGWQQVTLPAPVAVSANTTYVVSYFSGSGAYSYAAGGFASAVDAAPLHALANTESPNGVYRYGTASVFPTNSVNATNYWVDVVFMPPTGDTTAPSVSAVTPANGTAGLALTASMTASFSEAIDLLTITSSTVALRTAGNAAVPASLAYDAATRKVTLTPSAPLTAGSAYQMTLGTGIKDLAGNALASPVSWSFATAPAVLTPTQGPGGPILVVTSTSNAFTNYYAEILRAEGLNAFATRTLSQVTSSVLAGVDIVLLGEQTLTASQASMFSTWVNGGGKLIAFRPDSRLANTLGLTVQTGTTSNGYIAIDTTKSPGSGLPSQTLQFHGTADRYSPTSAAVLATLYSDATHSTPYPAVTLNTSGAGQAAAFAFDLARSVIYTRQGNPAWAGQARDGDPQGTTPPTIRSDDLFFGQMTGDIQPDWVDFTRITIPQADEQQRLLANLILQMEQGTRPLPRFWYFPRDLKAVVVMTGDDHGNGGTVARMNNQLGLGPAGCNVANWECIRSTSYVYPSTPITAAQASSFAAQGFEIGLHITMDPSTQYGCGLNFTSTTLGNAYTSQLASWTNKFTGVPKPVTTRTHCVMWSDWSTQATVEAANGIRLDTNYYYWPGSWVANRPGLFTGSGMPMRFADLSGNLIDVYQAATQMTDESAQSYPLHIDTLLDNALGANGYFGAFTANMHTDSASSSGSDAIVASAVARGVPVVSASQMLAWLDARNASAFGSITWSGSTMTFGVAPSVGATGLRVLIPGSTSAGSISGLTVNGAPAAYTLRTIKGRSYAVASATAGVFVVTYSQ